MNIDQLLFNINRYILNPLIGFLFVLATFLFIYGLVRFYIAGEVKDHEQGKRHIIYGLLGMFIMISVFGIMRLVIGTFGIDLPSGVSIPINQ